MFLSYLLTLNNCYGLLNVGSLWVLQVLLAFMYVVRLTSESKLARGVDNFSLSGWMYGLIDCVLALCSPLLPLTPIWSVLPDFGLEVACTMDRTEVLCFLHFNNCLSTAIANLILYLRISSSVFKHKNLCNFP